MGLGDRVAATSLSPYIADTIKKPSNLTLGLCEIEQNQVGGLGQPATVSDRPTAVIGVSDLAVQKQPLNAQNFRPRPAL